MTQPARRIDQILTSVPATAPLLARLAASRHVARLIAPVCTQVVPGFDPLRAGACELRGGVLRIWLRSTAQSNKMRQASARILAILRSNSLEISEIRVGVQPAKARDKARESAPVPGQSGRDTPPATPEERRRIARLQEFSRKLAVTLPDSDLRRAVTRLGGAVERRLARIRESDQSFEQQDGKKDDAGD